MNRHFPLHLLAAEAKKVGELRMSVEEKFNTNSTSLIDELENEQKKERTKEDRKLTPH